MGRSPHPVRALASGAGPDPLPPDRWMPPTVDPLVPLVLLEAVRHVDLPDGELEAEFVDELRTKRFGLSDTVRNQIRRYADAVKRGQRIGFEEAQGIARLIGRRPDAEAVFREAGRGLARQTHARIPAGVRRLTLALPTLLARPLALRQVAGVGRRVLDGRVRRVGATILLDVRESVTRDSAPRMAGCAFYESSLRELMQLLVGGVGAVEHVSCVTRGEGSCEWRAEWRTGR